MYEQEMVYHCYNQSNNYETVFYNLENFRYFLRKLRKHLLPCASILCYCLMYDHFHIMCKPTAHGCAPSNSYRFLRTTEDGSEVAAQQQLSQAFKTILSSYTQGINRQQNRRGSLWRAKTKGKPVYFDFGPDQTIIKPAGPLAELRPYLHTCFHYIHRNPVKAKYVNHPGEWEFSSALDYMGLRDSKLCDFALTEELLGITPNLSY